jgi:UDP-4-amino-4,6-dideoxy-N-acetyl-beta-L-altrosamine N-acetyltransferase
MKKNEKIRAMKESDLEQVLLWRNSADVRNYMFNSEIIKKDEHYEWFLRCMGDPSIELMIYDDGENARGYVQFTEKQTSGSFEWSFFVDPLARKGTGTCMGKVALDYIFNIRNAKKLCGQVLAFNKRSISLHSRMGFEIKTYTSKSNANKNFVAEVIFFCIYKKDWLGLN